MLTILPNALISKHDEISPSCLLHPSLEPWAETFAFHYRRDWFHSTNRNSMAWYAWLHNYPPAACALAVFTPQPDDQQLWLASPYHAQLEGSMFAVLPEYALSWSAADAEEVCKLLNPDLVNDGLRLEAIGAALILVSTRCLDVSPLPFSAIAGQSLPRQAPDGTDGSWLMRVMVDIQMQLYQHPVSIHGLWFWGGVALNDANLPSPQAVISPVLTCHTALQSLVGAPVDPVLMISETEYIHRLFSATGELPEYILLAGDKVGVLLTRMRSPLHYIQARIQKLKKRGWKPAATMSDESQLHKKLATCLAAS